MTQGPIKVSGQTKDRIRYAAAAIGLSQSELVDRAVTEYVERHAAELFVGLERARQALSRGLNASVAYALGVSEDEINRVAKNRPIDPSRSSTSSRQRAGLGRR